MFLHNSFFLFKLKSVTNQRKFLKMYYSFIKDKANNRNIYLHLNSNIPDEELVSSVLCFVFNKNRELLFVQEHGKLNIPGGKTESGESVHKTAYREVLEEAYIKIKNIRTIAYEEYKATGEKPVNYNRPFPITYLAYVTATIDEVLDFKENTETSNREFLSIENAHKQDGVHYRNRHIIFDKLLNQEI